MSAFDDDFAKAMKDPNFAYEFGKQERELEIIKLLEDDYKSQNGIIWAEPHLKDLIALIKGENK